ncbi:hypothetical protein ACC759_38895, partial [Rhizobium ruizarguesonis]
MTIRLATRAASIRPSMARIISSINLLQVFLNADKYADGKIMWLTLMHLAFVASAVMLGLLEKLMSVTSKNDLKDKG